MAIVSQATTNDYGRVIEAGMIVEWESDREMIHGEVIGIDDRGRVVINRAGAISEVDPNRLIAVIIVD